MAGDRVPETTVREAVARALLAVSDAGSAQPLASWEEQYPSVRARCLSDASLLLADLAARGVTVEASDAR